jgi:hypothetical protein
MPNDQADSDARQVRRRGREQQVRRREVSLVGRPEPGETGVRYLLDGAPRALTISVPAADEVWVTVGCHRVRFTAAEARLIAADVADAAEEADPP